MSESLTPMMQQYQGIRRTLPEGTLLLYRLGDFYEMFFEDAKEGSVILNVALTKRNQVPMCGIPHAAADAYIRKLIQAGRRVAICDQVSDPQPGKIVQREVTQIISPGTVSDLNMLDSRRNNYLAAVCRADEKIGFAYVDLSTGEFRVTEAAGETEFQDELARVQPAEILVSDAQREEFPELQNVVVCDAYSCLYDQAYFTLREHFQVQSLDGYGCQGVVAGVCAAGAVIHYLKHNLRRSLHHVTSLTWYQNSSFMIVDAATQANLELVSSRASRDTSLLACLDRTVTPMGARKLRDWILHPLCELAAIQNRQQLVADLLTEPYLLSKLRDTLRNIRDMERTIGRLTQTGGNARDLNVLRTSLEQIPALRADLEAISQGNGLSTPVEPSPLLREVLQDLHELPHVVSLLARAVVEEPPVNTKEGGIFQDGYFPGLDELRNAGREGKEWIAQLQQREMDSSGIKSLKVRYTSVFGYFIEVTKSNLHLVPERWQRKQTIANGERFITPELKEIEGKILGADERAKALEYELFLQLRDEALKELLPMQRTAHAIGIIDAICSLAETARLYNYCRPEITDGLRICIRDGRHPVLDQHLVEEKFVPNDVELDGSGTRLLIITGPNMAGKSTYIRQVALLVLMAQVGSFIPAASAEIGMADRIFTRVGSGDNLARGQSTFMVEMNETANIMNNATVRSLVILDEIGRGTSTFDGLSIAWSVAEYLHDKLRARTLFATHYHELTELEMTRPGVKNFNVAVREWNDQVIFLRKIVKGGADKSYGIQVARLAGLPAEIVSRAKQILSNLEASELNADGKPKLAEAPSAAPRRKRKDSGIVAERPQLSLF